MSLLLISMWKSNWRKIDNEKIKKHGKRILSFALSIFLAAGMIPAAGFTAQAEQAGELVLDNGYIRAEVSEENGGFAIRTVEGDKVNKDDNNKNLLFHSSEDDTSFTSFQVTRNGEVKEYIFGGDYEGSSEVKTSKENEEIKAIWSVDDLTFTETISLVNSGASEHGTVYISYTVENAGEAADVKCRILLDTALGSQDYAYYNVGNGNQLIEQEVTLSQGGYNKSFYAVDDPLSPSITAYIMNASVNNQECMPYQTTFAHWNNLASTVFDYTPDNTLTFTNPYNRKYLTADSAFALYFDMGNVQQNRTADIAANYGVFSNETVDKEATAAVNVIAPDVMELTSDRTAYKNDGLFTASTAIENISENTYERVRVVVYASGGITPLDENGDLAGSSYDDPYYKDYINFVPGQIQNIEWDFQAVPKVEGAYSRIQYKIYDVSDEATLNTGKLLAENLLGEGQCYILCPGTINEVPAIQFTGSSPEVLYHQGTRNLYVTGANFSMLTNTGEYKLMLSRVDGQKFGGVQSIQIPDNNIKIDDSQNTITVVMNDECPGTLPEGEYQLTFDYTDAAKEDLTAPALRFQVKENQKYRNDSYGLLVVEKADDLTYHVKTFSGETDYQSAVESGAIDREDVLLEFRGIFTRNGNSQSGSHVVYSGISLDSDDNVMTLNNCLDIKEGSIVITEDNGTVLVDFDAKIYTTGAGTFVWDGVCALTALEAGKDYGLIPYKENGDRESFGFHTITLLWPSVGQAAQNLMGFLMDFKYGELGVISHEDAPETRVVAFGAAMDLSFVIPQASQSDVSNKSLLGDAYNAAIHAGDVDAEALRSINKRIPYNSDTVNTDAGDSDEEDSDNISASIQIDDVLFGGKYLGVNMTVSLGIPGYVEGTPSLEGVLTIKTVGDWEVGASGVCDFQVCCFEGEIYIKSRNGMPVPDKITFFLGGITPGINVDGMGILWLQGAGGGIDNLYDTIFLQDAVPPLKLILKAQFSLMQIISAKAELQLSLRGFGIELSDGTLANAVPVLNSARLQFDWYPEFYFLSSVNISIYDAIVGSGYIVAEDNGFFEFFVRAALQIPDDIPIIGGMTVAQAGLGANNQKIWGQVEVIGIDLGIVYYWGGSINWGGGTPAVPTYPDLADMGTGSGTALMSEDDIPVYFDEETGQTLYAHVGTNLNSNVQMLSEITSVKSLDNTIYTAIDGKSHTITLAENNKDKLLVLEWEAESLEEARKDLENIQITGNLNGTSQAEYILTLLADSQENANANLTYNEETGTVTLAVSFTEPEDFEKVWTVTTENVSSAVLYEIDPLPALSDTTAVSVSADGMVTVDLRGQELEKFSSISFIAVKNSDTVSTASLLSGLSENVLPGSRLAAQTSDSSAVSETEESAELVYRTETFGNGTEIQFPLPETFETGTYTLRMIAEDDAADYYSELGKKFEYININHPDFL